ncbi:MAG TPA: urease accessory protein UreE [Vicinamibacterales bacterium]|nr:urease accessory protein UreE [Vicinamibacterales bacterium]
MFIIDRLYRDELLPAAAAEFAEDTITLGWEDRQKGHARRRTDQGVEFGLSLPPGVTLQEGDRLVLEPPQRVVRVREAEEEVFVIRPATPQAWAWNAYHIGNRHQPLMISDEELICPRVPGVEQLLDQLRIPYAAARRRFTPAIARVGHDHDREHAHVRPQGDGRRHRHD